jgi:hypothetical protein
MKVCHWSIQNKSGMNRVAESCVAAEHALGIESVFANPQDSLSYLVAEDADVQVSHTHFPDVMRKRVKKPLKLAWCCHGTPEHIFASATEEGAKKCYGHADGWMLTMNWLRTADAIITFWPRHQAIWQSLCDRNTVVRQVPLGVDRGFWMPQATRGKFAGTPSVFTAENCHQIKWPLDLFLAWPWVYPHIDGALLHAAYLPNDMHRWWFPLVNRNGCSYGAHLSPIAFDHDNLRNAFCSVDYYIGLVRYGDFNRIGLEANACGTKTISYAGNEYSDYWITEGDQRVIAKELLAILNGETKPRSKTPVPDVKETAAAMIQIYEKLLNRSDAPKRIPVAEG